MAQLVITNLDDSTLALLKQRAKRHGHSVSAEVRIILQNAASGCGDWADQVEKVRMLFDGRHFSDSSELVRKDRER